MLYVIINMLENQNILAKNQKLLKKNFITKKKKKPATGKNSKWAQHNNKIDRGENQ